MSEPSGNPTENRKAPLPLEEHARVAAWIAANQDRPTTDVLSVLGLSLEEWEEAESELVRRLTEEIQQGSTSSAPIEERYSLSMSYAKAYSDALKELSPKPASDEVPPDEEATIRIPPGASKSAPFGLLSASNKAAGG